MKKLNKYLSFTTATATSTLLNASVVYTDLDPDITLNVDGDNYEIDFNNDGNPEYDIQFVIDGIGGGYGPPIDIYQPKIQGILDNKVGAYYLNGGGWGNPMLPENFIFPYYSQSNIDQSLLWSANDALFGYYFFWQGGYGQGGGPQSQGAWSGLDDRFAALRFSLNGNIHYGWVRCNVDLEYKGIKVIDYAYNDTPDTPIKAGATYDIDLVADSIIATDISNNGNGLDLNVSFNKANIELGIQEYRIIAVKSSNANSFSVSDANATSFYKSIIPNGNNIEITLDEISKDSDGDIIEEGVEYNIFVLTTPDLVDLFNSNLSLPSNNVTLMSNVSIEESVFSNIHHYIDGQNLIIRSDINIDNINILNLSGKNIYNQQNMKNSTFDMSIVSKGIYLIQLEIENQLKMIKIIIP